MSANEPRLSAYWALSQAELEQLLDTTPRGLSEAEAIRRAHDADLQKRDLERAPSRWQCLLHQVKSPLVLLLLLAAGASMATGNWVDAVLVLAIVFASVAFSFTREYRAQAAAATLKRRVEVRANVIRDGQPRSVPRAEVAPGDLFLLSAGSLVPADARVIEANDCHVNESVLTGESYPSAKQAGVVSRDAPLARRSNCVFLGTHVRSGTALCLAVRTGQRTQYGSIAQRLTLRGPETDFDRGIRQFGYLLGSAMLVMVLAVFAANVVLGRPAVDTLLFSIALAVGLSPELLPAILSVNLARGAQGLAKAGVLVKQLNAIENLGSMDTLCTDKTGTLTDGVVRLEGGYDADGEPSLRPLELAAHNALLQSGLKNPLDEAIANARPTALGPGEKLAEAPYDFVRKRVSVVMRDGERALLVTKGAFEQVLEACTHAHDQAALTADMRETLRQRYQAWSARGIRVLGIASRSLPLGASYGREDERELRFEGFVTFLDRPKPGIAAALSQLRALGVSVKMISGDSRLVCQNIAAQIGLDPERVLTGADLDTYHDEALWHTAERTEVFAEVDPNQKERIILALKKMGHVVGFLGDGINDAPAMHAADTSFSVDSATDVAKEAADFVLLERDLDVIRSGIAEGRKTFANTLKYVLTTTSANLGNMISMAVASMTLPFLPLLAGQILLNNFLSDIPAIGLADDAVDPEWVSRPRRWSMPFIRRFMLVFGGLSSCFDLLTFALLLWVFHAGAAQFQTAWFFESLLTELLVALVVRTWRPFFRSRPGHLLLASSLLLAALSYALPYLPFAHWFGFVPLPPAVLGSLTLVALLYVLVTELVKARLYGAGRPPFGVPTGRLVPAQAA